MPRAPVAKEKMSARDQRAAGVGPYRGLDCATRNRRRARWLGQDRGVIWRRPRRGQAAKTPDRSGPCGGAQARAGRARRSRGRRGRRSRASPARARATRVRAAAQRGPCGEAGGRAAAIRATHRRRGARRRSTADARWRNEPSGPSTAATRGPASTRADRAADRRASPGARHKAAREARRAGAGRGARSSPGPQEFRGEQQREQHGERAPERAALVAGLVLDAHALRFLFGADFEALEFLRELRGQLG